MTEQLYPNLQSTTDSQLNYMMDKQKALKEKLLHYTKVKNNWSVANTVLKITGISVSCILAGASILTVTPFSVPIAAAILGGISIGNISLSNLLIEGFTSKRKRYFRLKCDRITEYLNKLEILFIKSKKDGQISHDEFELFQKLLRDYENETHMSVGVTSKDLKKAHKMAKNEIRQQQMSILVNKSIQEYQQKLK